MGEPLNVGIVGLGTISKQYFDTFATLDSVRITAVADLDAELTGRVAEGLGAAACTVPELVTRDDVDLVLNLTIPVAHRDVALAAIAGGKGVYGEKPLALDTAQAREVLTAADNAGVVVGCAPDTVLGTGTQTARKAIDDGLIGRPIAASATMLVPGHERWHPNPDFYYQPGGGPLLDMGPYYLSALITLLGPVAAVTGAASRTRSTRTIGSGPRTGQSIPVATDTHITAILTHESGALSTVMMSFDVVATRTANIEIHGELGSLVVPDPNRFAGDVQLQTLESKEWEVLPVSAGYLNAGRGIGIADLAATPDGEVPRAGGALAFHVLDVMEAVLASSVSGAARTIGSTVARPSAVPLQTMW
ncbi:Predicted dehydrogenase [Nakamurella panacisegetis]|uniref:Predicted dehydrogenase n=1 Tax=Nakamurella panacisegetis TaxID=1090615 RepID=A0A1H0M1R4_9ACTN|nr:Gfo/Idh/MocA family oxidoreductase [Nakamurella panacisegetis]SDO74294.1 Predicted dehydrogenase [Nakamurella panacisegetis]